MKSKLIRINEIKKIRKTPKAILSKKNVSVINFVSTGTIEHRMLSVLKFKASLAEDVLDNGDDTIIMDESRFKAFMKNIEDITINAGQEMQPEGIINSEEENEVIELASQEEAVETADTETKGNDQLSGDDDVSPQGIIPSQSQSKSEHIEDDPAMMIQTGMHFLSGLLKTLSSPESTEKLVNSIVDKDPSTGKTYLKIPIENEKVVSDVLGMLGKFLNSFGNR